VALKGSRELRARLKSLRLAFKPVGKAWADDTAHIARSRVPVRTGRLRSSIRRRNATQKRATVVGHYTANFIDHGTKQHDIRPKKAKTLAFSVGGRTVFAKKVHKRATRGNHFKRTAALEALRRNPLAAEVINQWNAAA
jgi:hypothetical protein